MRVSFTKIAFLFLCFLLILGCDSTKRVPAGKKLLVKTDIVTNDKKTIEEDVLVQVYQKPNSALLGKPLRLYIYNWAKPNKDSLYTNWLQKHPKTHKKLTALLSEKQVERLGKSFLVSGIGKMWKGIGEQPVILDTNSTKKSLVRLKAYYFNKGYFDVTGKYKVDTIGKKKASINYDITLNKRFLIDSVSRNITTPALDSMYVANNSKTKIVSNKPFDIVDFEEERSRITSDFRNNGAFEFQPSYVNYDLDTIGTNKKINVKIKIKDFAQNINDSLVEKPFTIYKINKVSIFTDRSISKNDNYIAKDTVYYKGYTLLSQKKLKYKPKSITNAIFINPGSLYSDNRTTLTSRYLSNLNVFNYPNIVYKQDEKDPSKLNAEIYLSPRKKFTFNPSFDLTHSNIQEFGISGNVNFKIRNIFNGTETFDIGLRGNLGSSSKVSNPLDKFFNISEYGIDARLNFPRIFFPIPTDKIIRKRMIPSTTWSMGYYKQQNIGLDKQNLTSTFAYNWTPKKNTTARFELFNIQFVKNLNVGNYFNIYQSSYNAINDLAAAYGTSSANLDANGNLTIDSGVNTFINDVMTNPFSVSQQDFKTILSIEERRKRLTENNFILASNFSYNHTTRDGTQDNTFYSYRFKAESAGNLLSILSKAKQKVANQNDAIKIFDVAYSQYLKGEAEFIKHFDLRGNKILAFRAFTGIAIPYGNSTSVPFSRSYFSGGSNDNRAWQPYSLGPGSVRSLNDFNEANLKISANAEFRFSIVGKFRGALFADVGNIWNVSDNAVNDDATFKGLKSIQEFAVGTGTGLRYDQGLFVVRFDLGFKTYNPALPENRRWFKELNMSQAILNVGINYPF